ncbi:MAG: hypothetical protein FGM15_05795 [Chthoniobacterales bacterium]|nr:hypothetical protein [Chthoniobacterales bacterium]
MKMVRAATGLLVAMLLLAGGLYFFRNDLVNWWIRRELASSLSQVLGAKVSLHDVSWEPGLLRAGHFRLEGEGNLPLESLAAEGVRAPVAWQRLLDPAQGRLHIETDRTELVWNGRQKAAASAAKSTTGPGLPALDLLVGRLTFRHADHSGWELRDMSMRAGCENGVWSFSGKDGTAVLPGTPPLKIERVSAQLRDGHLEIGSFAVHDSHGGVLGGSARHSESGWTGEFSWQDVGLDAVLSPAVSTHFEGRCSGDARLSGGTLRGSMKITGGVSKSMPQLVKMASLFAGENWNEIPWETFRFDFIRSPDGRMEFSNLEAVSGKGLSVNGSGHYAPGSLGADLQLGVRRQGRPWLVGFVPLLFRGEKDGYLWTSVRVGGTPAAPTEDLTARVVAALAAAPATEAVEAAAEMPGTAVEAAGSLLRGFLRR